jgi:uncharacterized protein involved in exopolysaccharide biosynthesis
VQDKESGMVKIAITSLSPESAKIWLELLVKDINEYIRARDIAQAEASINYLTEKLKEMSIAEMQQVFYQLIDDQTKSMMLAAVQKEYALKTIDPPLTPQSKSFPKTAVFVLLVTLVVFIASCFFSIVHSQFTKRNARLTVRT